MTTLKCPICAEFLLKPDKSAVIPYYYFQCADKSHLVLYHNSENFVVAKYTGARALGVKAENLEYEFYGSGEYPDAFDIKVLPFAFEEAYNVLNKCIKLLTFR